MVVKKSLEKGAEEFDETEGLDPDEVDELFEDLDQE